MASVINTLVTDTGSNKTNSSSSTKTTTQTNNQAASSSSSGSGSGTKSTGNIRSMDDIQNSINKVKSDMGITEPATTSAQAAQNRQTVSNAINTLVNNAKTAWNNATSSSGSGSGGSGGNGGGGGSAAVAPTPARVSYTIGSDPNTGVKATDEAAGNETKRMVDQVRDALGTYNIAPVDLIDISQQKAELNAQKNIEEERATNQINYAVSQGITELMRNVEDAKKSFQTQRNQVDADEQRALDNQVLYAEARGDRGGIGQAQYGAVQNTAAVNRLAVNQAETKLQTDTNRQIADLRAQGEFDKADKLLQIAQNYQAQLMNLEMWAKENNVSIEEFNVGIQEWQAEYQKAKAQLLTDTEMQMANMTGAFSTGQRTNAAINADREMIANAAASLIQAGVAPTQEQLAALGWTPSQAVSYLGGYYPYGIQV